ncbi:hypothetical protein HU200_014685 [Digitaria exilis]|uniref:Cupin type-1 domain-containing protein n=1 Tax=Digitaria exilis TaxID=1010633 RepID=A0A835FBM3_9POAL|nr:hypothetical protein HU200_014685 [Digitaria exilis]
MEHFNKALTALFSLLLLAPLLVASDPDPLQDFCVADLTGTPSVNGYPCQPPSSVGDEFLFSSKLATGGDPTLNPNGSNVTRLSVNQWPGVNTLGLSTNRIDFAPGGTNPPHVHPRATEVGIVAGGELLVGIIGSGDSGNRSYSNSNLWSKTTIGPTPKNLAQFSLSFPLSSRAGPLSLPLLPRALGPRARSLARAPAQPSDAPASSPRSADKPGPPSRNSRDLAPRMRAFAPGECAAPCQSSLASTPRPSQALGPSRSLGAHAALAAELARALATARSSKPPWARIPTASEPPRPTQPLAFAYKKPAKSPIRPYRSHGVQSPFATTTNAKQRRRRGKRGKTAAGRSTTTAAGRRRSTPSQATTSTTRRMPTSTTTTASSRHRVTSPLRQRRPASPNPSRALGEPFQAAPPSSLLDAAHRRSAMKPSAAARNPTYLPGHRAALFCRDLTAHTCLRTHLCHCGTGQPGIRGREVAPRPWRTRAHAHAHALTPRALTPRMHTRSPGHEVLPRTAGELAAATVHAAAVTHRTGATSGLAARARTRHGGRERVPSRRAARVANAFATFCRTPCARELFPIRFWIWPHTHLATQAQPHRIGAQPHQIRWTQFTRDADRRGPPPSGPTCQVDLVVATSAGPTLTLTSAGHVARSGAATCRALALPRDDDREQLIEDPAEDCDDYPLSPGSRPSHLLNAH